MMNTLIKTKDIYNKLKLISNSIKAFDTNKIKDIIDIMYIITDGTVDFVKIDNRCVEMIGTVGNQTVRHLIFDFQYIENLEESVNDMTMAYYIKLCNGKCDYNNTSDLIRAIITI